eukprot:895517_1
MYSATNHDDITSPDNWSHVRFSWGTDRFFEELYDMVPKHCNALNANNVEHLVLLDSIHSKITNELSTSSRKLELRSRVEESTISCIHELHGDSTVFVDTIMNAIQSYMNYAHEYSNESMIEKHYANSNNQDTNENRKGKRKRRHQLNHKTKKNLKQRKKQGQNPLHFKEIFFGPSPSFTICNQCIILFFIQSKKLKDLLGFIHSALRSQYIEFEYVLNTMTWFICKMLLHPLIRKTVFNDTFMREYFLAIWHKLWVDNKYYYLTHHVKRNNQSFTNVFINILPTMFYNFNFILTLTLVNFKYADINDKLVRNEAFQWQRILAFVVQQSDMAFNCKQRFMNQDDDMFYNLGNIVNDWMAKYSCNHWFDTTGWQNESVAHYQIGNIRRFFERLVSSKALTNAIKWRNKSPLKEIKTISNSQKACTRCNKAKIYYDEEQKYILMRTLKICKGCCCVYYCSRKCQKYDWSKGKHKTFCKALQIEYSTYLVYQ